MVTADPFRATPWASAPATLLPEPITCDAAGLRDLTWASAAAGFPTFSLWSFYADGKGVDTARMMFDDAGVSVRAVEAATRWTEGPEGRSRMPTCSSTSPPCSGPISSSPAPWPRPWTPPGAPRASRRCANTRLEARRPRRHRVPPVVGGPRPRDRWRSCRSRGRRTAASSSTCSIGSGTGGPNLELLRQIPGDRIPTCRCATPPGPSGTHDYLTEALTGRPAPGQGCVDIAALLGVLAEIDADPYFALEVFNAELAARGPSAMAAELRPATRTVFD